jgi:hypothetical protein
MALREKIYLNRDNAIKLGLTADGAAVDASSLTRVVAKLTDENGVVTTYDSNTDAAAFDFTNETAQVSDTVTGILVIKLQDAASPPAAGNDYTMDLILYDSLSVDGIHWDSAFPVQVIDA